MTNTMVVNTEAMCDLLRKIAAAGLTGPWLPQYRPGEPSVLRQNVSQNFTFDLGQTKISSIESIGQFRVVDAHLMQNGRVDIVGVDSVFDRLVTEFIRRSVLSPALEAATREPSCEGIRIMISASDVL